MTTRRWGHGQPGGHGEDCMAVSHDGFHDYPCRDYLSYVCEK